MKTYKTNQGDTWDLISFKAYGIETAIDKLMAANPDYKEIEVFPSGMVIEIPEADSQAMKDNRNLPPWKRNKG